MAWNIHQGGSGFAPPYALPSAQNAVALSLTSPPPSSTSHQTTDQLPVVVRAGEASKTFDTRPATAEKYVRSLATGRRGLPPPAVVFCSRELENGLAGYIASEMSGFGGRFPSDEELRGKAREILGTAGTAADNPVLLGKFKEMMRERLGVTTGEAEGGGRSSQGEVGGGTATTTAAAEGQLVNMALDLDLALTDGQITDMLQDMEFEFGDVGGLDDQVLGTGFGL